MRCDRVVRSATGHAGSGDASLNALVALHGALSDGSRPKAMDYAGFCEDVGKMWTDGEAMDWSRARLYYRAIRRHLRGALVRRILSNSIRNI